MTVGIVGLGLIGGSLAKCFSQHGHRVLACDRDADTMAAALGDGAVQEELTPARFGRCELILVCLWPQKTVDYIEENRSAFPKGGLVVDCCGVKGEVCRQVWPIAREEGFTFVGGHPMAGRELSGYRASQADLFHRASMILTPAPGCDGAVVEGLRTLFLSLHFRQVVLSTPEEHDRIIALTSQLCHIVSNCFVKSPTAGDFGGFSAGSFKDLTRVAKLNEAMWTDLFSQNRAALLAELDIFSDNLARYRAALAQGDDSALEGLLREGREKKEGLTLGNHTSQNRESL